MDWVHRYEDYDTVGARVIAKDSGNWFNVFAIDIGFRMTAFRRITMSSQTGAW